mmetsp:Transcript_37868/g.78632  ORF Transcript_37868/g.78632 Transcript_37868/m.78632 type:complete len:416 (-) Transcript_37868:196-1443(-)
MVEFRKTKRSSDLRLQCLMTTIILFQMIPRTTSWHSSSQLASNPVRTLTSRTSRLIFTIAKRNIYGMQWHPSGIYKSTTRPRISPFGTQLYQSISSTDSSSSPAEKQNQAGNHDRRDLLHTQLERLGIDPAQLSEASNVQYRDPIQGYDGRFGKSAIRTYRSFVEPKKTTALSNNSDNQNILSAQAFRTAQQIDFLMKRHASHETEWIRHQDAKDPTVADGDESTRATDSQPKRFPLILILDNLRSALNVGSLFRTADAAGCAQVWTVGITPHPNGNGAEKLRKSALGAETVVPHRHFATLQDAMTQLRDQGADDGDRLPDEASTNLTTDQHQLTYQIIGMETTDKSKDYTKVQYDASKGVALVLGNEVTGVTASVLPQMDMIVEIPTYGVKNSLNVASCAPIVLYEILRQWNAE